jgi:hypothetical protein
MDGSMADPRELARLTQPELELALADLGRALAWPAAAVATSAATPDATTDDPAARARRRIVTEGLRPGGTGWLGRRLGRPLRSSLVLAAAAILVIAALAAAIGFGLPGIRFTVISSPTPLPQPTPTATLPSPSPTPGPLGSNLGLGDPFPPGRARTAVSFPVRLPPDSLGTPASAWFLDGRLSVVWPAGPELPPLDESDLGLVLTELEGDVDAGYFEKIMGPGTRIQTAAVDGVTGYWISGRPHQIVYVTPHGDPVFDEREVVGNTLLWARDGVTYRLESALDREAAIALAESLR